MSELIVLGFDTEADADAFGAKIATMQQDLVLQLSDAAQVVLDDKGKPKVKHGAKLVGAGALGGAFWGMLFGLLFFMPFLGAAIGAGFGALFGKLGDSGLDKQFVEQMRGAIGPGQSGWFLVVEKMTEDKFLAEGEGTKARILRTSLSAEQEAKLKKAFGAEDHKKG